MLVGTHTYAASGDALRRQQASAGSLAALDVAEAVNVQFAEGAHALRDLETLAVLRLDANGITGRRGPRKPIVSEVFDALAREAERRGCGHFCFANGDIIVRPEAVAAVLSSPHDAWVFSRQDFDRVSGVPTRMEIAGSDVFACRVSWWRAHRRHFRPYILGEGGWDNIYTAVVMCHGNARLENRRPLVWHEAHAPGPMPSPHYGQYIRRLAAFDAGYFTLWCRYWDGLVRLRAAGASEADELDLARGVFVWKPSARQRIVQGCRSVKAELRYRWWRLRAGAG
jgi:hypothetical protein